jgi:exopolyphosphatase/guanosine-5'-triphosphate,3'-diphosphate pyrophosphatase
MSTSPKGTRAALDCGTNSTRLLVVDQGGEPLARLMEITRLGEGVDAIHRLSPDAIARTLNVLKGYRAVMDELGVARARLVATSAVRDAGNGQEFLDAASEVTGVHAELLSGLAEGELAFRGATSGLEPAAGDDVVVDIGGGSTELVVMSNGQLGAVSLDLGCVRLTERQLKSDPPTPDQLAATRRTIAQELDRAQVSVPALGRLRAPSRLIGLAGTVSTLAALDQHLAHYDRERIHHAHLTRSAVDQWCDTLGAEPARARAERPGMVSGREDVIVGGALVLQSVMARFDFPECLVSESDILDGLVASID